MSLRDFKCSRCTSEFSWEIPISQPSPKKCPECNEETLEFVVGPFIGFMMDPKTVGGQSDKNTKNMGTYARETEIGRMKQEREDAILARKKSGLQPWETLKETPWFRNSDKIDTSIAGLKGEALQKYIHTGEK